MQDLQKSGKEFNEICQDLLNQMKLNKDAKSQEVQAIIKRHYIWLKNFWTPNKESYIGLGSGYTSAEWNKTFEQYPEGFAQYLAEGMKVFAEKNLE